MTLRAFISFPRCYIHSFSWNCIYGSLSLKLSIGKGFCLFYWPLIVHSCFTSCIFAARTLDFAVKFRLVFRYEAVVFRRYVLALLLVGLSLIWTKNPRRFSFFSKIPPFHLYVAMVSPCHPQFSRANWWHAQSFFSSVSWDSKKERLHVAWIYAFGVQRLFIQYSYSTWRLKAMRNKNMQVCAV